MVYRFAFPVLRFGRSATSPKSHNSLFEDYFCHHSFGKFLAKTGFGKKFGKGQFAANCIIVPGCGLLARNTKRIIELAKFGKGNPPAVTSGAEGRESASTGQLNTVNQTSATGAGGRSSRDRTRREVNRAAQALHVPPTELLFAKKSV